jgi:hypothetical protein
MSESTEDSVPETHDPDASVTASPSLAIPSNKYSDLFGLFPPELFDGFEEFVRESRLKSANVREPPPWW